MSSRAIERLRRERQGAIPSSTIDEDHSEGDDSDEDDHQPTRKSNVFAAAMFDSSDDESSDDSDEDSDGDSDTDPNIKSRETTECSKSPAAENQQEKEDQTADAEDLDALLQEYKLQDAEYDEKIVANDGDPSLVQYSIITARIETRDLDIENARRLLFGGIETSGVERRSHRHSFLFGNPSENWSRPPHYVGGGLGFFSYADMKESHSQALPWPYCDMKEGDVRCPPLKNWFQFTRSDSYQRDFEDMTIIQNSGDPNAMLLFIAHHPYVVEALLQMSVVMYQMNKGNEGLSFLKRALWIFECATPNSFLKVNSRCAFMDYQRDGNSSFFSTLFQLIRVSYIGGLMRTAFAVSQLLLSLDPLRDPKNILLGIDYFALICNTESSKRWLVDFVESKKVYVVYKNEESQEQFECQILELPNWGYSYALALFDIDDEGSLSEKSTKEQANNALKLALCRFPTVIGQLLAMNEIDKNSRSVRTDWPAALEHLDELISEFQKRIYDIPDSITRARISQAYDTIVKISVQQSFKLWSSSAVLTWVYDNLMALREERGNGSVIEITPLSPAIIRYVDSDPNDYVDKFQTMPAEANPFDQNLVAHALNVDPNRRRLVQRNQRNANVNIMDDNGVPFATRDGYFVGPMEMVDPDLPLLELFWRSALPWAHVEGVPPANR